MALVKTQGEKEMSIDWSRKDLTTRNGKYSVEVLTTNRRGLYPVVVLLNDIENPEDSQQIRTFMLDGRGVPQLVSKSKDNWFDIIEPKERYLIIEYKIVPDGHPKRFAPGYTSEDSADKTIDDSVKEGYNARIIER